MNRRETFIIILLYDPQRNAEMRGRLRHVASSREATFKKLDELPRLLCQFMAEKGSAGNEGQGTTY